MARTTQVLVHGVLTDVIEMDLPADQLEDAMRAEIAADAAEQAAEDAQAAQEAAEDAAIRAEGAVAGVVSFNGRNGTVSPQAGDYTAAMVGAVPSTAKGAAGGVASLGADGRVPASQIPDPVYSAVTMLAASWASNTYSFEADYPAADYNISIEVAPTATTEQFEAFVEAMICGNATSNVATALGDVPTVDIPVIVKAVRK